MSKHGNSCNPDIAWPKNLPPYLVESIKKIEAYSNDPEASPLLALEFENLENLAKSAVITHKISRDDATEILCKINPNINDEEFQWHRNHAICEWLSSHIYADLGFEAQETMLGYMHGKLAVACKYIVNDDEEIWSLEKIIKGDRRVLLGSFGSVEETDDLDKISTMLNSVQRFIELKLSEHFWDLFVVDALIANTDRNTENVGLIYNRKSKNCRIAPVYDNANSFHFRMEDDEIKLVFKNWKKMSKILLEGGSPYFQNGEQVRPVKYISAKLGKDCIAAIGRVVPRIDMKKCVTRMLELRESKIISKTQAAFYVALLSFRYKKCLRPAYEKYFGPIEAKKAKKRQTLKP